MNTSLDCIPCLFRQALEAVRLITDAPVIHERVMREILHWAGILIAVFIVLSKG